jgi:hypothetical protein
MELTVVRRVVLRALGLKSQITNHKSQTIPNDQIPNSKREAATSGRVSFDCFSI